MKNENDFDMNEEEKNNEMNNEMINDEENLGKEVMVKINFLLYLITKII